MNRTGRFKVFMTMGLAVLLVVLGIVFVFMKPDNSGVLWLMFALILLLALVAVVVTYSQYKVMKSRVNQLSETYQKAYVDAGEAIGLTNMSKGMKKEIMANILEIFEHADLAGRPLTDVIDQDLKSFLEPFIAVGGGKFSMLYMMNYAFVMLMGYLLLMKLYKVLRSGFAWSNFETETLDLGITLTYTLIALIFFPWLTYVMKRAASEQWQGLKHLWVMVPFIIPLGLMSLLILIRDEAIKAFLDKPVPLFSSPLAFVCGLLLMGILIMTMGLIQKHNLKKGIGKD